jgi:RNA polymerase sigma factor (TIGR02999 family)
VTALLVEWASGRGGALDRLLPMVYAELRRLAVGHLRRERRDHTLQPTALINELYLLLVQQHAATWQNRAHFFALASRLMRRILVDHARARQADKRGGGRTTVALDDNAEAASSSGGADRSLEVLAVDEALGRLTALDAEQGRIVELRFFAGLNVEETAYVLDRSPRTVKREWRLAKAWLHRELGSA